MFRGSLAKVSRGLIDLLRINDRINNTDCRIAMAKPFPCFLFYGEVLEAVATFMGFLSCDIYRAVHLFVILNYCNVPEESTWSHSEYFFTVNSVRINFTFPLQPPQEYYITQYEELGILAYSDERLLQYQLSLPHYTFLFKRLGECIFRVWQLRDKTEYRA